MADSDIENWEHHMFSEELESTSSEELQSACSEAPRESASSEDELPTIRVASTAPKDAATKARIEHNATHSPLLRLPLEIRINIYGHLLGHRMINVQEEGFVKRCKNRKSLVDERYRNWFTLMCPRNYQRPKAEEMTQLDRVNDQFNVASVVEHQSDSELSYNDWSIHLRVLLACRQLYNEVNQVFWTTNTFSFNDGNGLLVFYELLEHHQKTLLRKLRLVFGWDHEGIESWGSLWGHQLWNSCLEVSILKKFKAVAQLQLEIYMARDADHWQWVKSQFGITDALGASDPEKIVRFASLIQWDIPSFADGMLSQVPGDCAMRLSILPLTNVSVVVHADENGMGWSQQVGGHGQPKLWSVEDREQFAGIIRDRLLAGGGIKAYKDGVKAWRTFQKEYEKKERERKASGKHQLYAA